VIPAAKPLIGEEERAAVDRVLRSGMMAQGPEVAAFETEFAAAVVGGRTCVAVNSGTSGQHLGLLAAGVGAGDEVIVPSFTFAATANSVALTGATPVFVDIEPDYFGLSAEAVESAVTERTVGIMPVHLYGQSEPMKEIMDLAVKYGLTVVEDNAQAIGGDYTFPDGKTQKTGTIGTIGTTSFFPSKNLGAYGDGGALFTRDAALADTFKMIANHGMKKRYYHEIVGCNSRLDTMQAAILNVKLPLLDQYINRRIEAADYYDRAFAGHPKIRTPYRAPYTKHVFHQYTLMLEGADRNKLNEFLASKNIPSMIYYPVPAHRQNMFASFQSAMNKLEVTDWLTDRVISLPMHTELDEEQLSFICTSVLEFLN
jgi:dTDP-4-amino-4,6-dideoxygalactose transaminase